VAQPHGSERAETPASERDREGPEEHSHPNEHEPLSASADRDLNRFSFFLTGRRDMSLVFKER
jgi:hypothetical protein